MYSTVIPSLIAMLQDEPLTMFPRSYHTSNDLIVLDDLRSHGYRTGDHGTGLDAAHCKLIFAELGRFHAATYVLKKSDSTETSNALSEVSREVQFTKERSSMYEEHLAQLARNTTDIIRNNPKTSRYAKQVEGILSNTHHHLLTFLKPRESFSTLTHGDLWTNNIMFRYSEDEPVSAKFLDFQTCRYGSPALDINYFLYTSTTSDVRERYMDDFMRTYHRSLSRTLHQLGLKTSPNLAELRREVDSISLYGFLAAHLVLQDTFSDPNFEGDAGNFFSERIADVVLDLGEQGVF
jgi:aminoglycoside/choline kinase family phosphotransferase